MTDEVFNIVSAIGIVLTFLASIAAVIASIISLKYSYKIAKRSGYLNTITASREKWSDSLRDSAILYFTQIARICSEQEDNLGEIYNELTHYYFAIVLLLFEQDKELYHNMSIVQGKASEIVKQSNIINQQSIKECTENQEIVIEAREKINMLRRSILYDYQEKIFKRIRDLIEREWRKQQYEATND